MTRFDPIGALRTLVEHRVRFVVIGGLGASLYGSSSITNDLDICYASDLENLEHLAAALRSMGARLRGVDDDVAFQMDPAAIAAGDHFTFQTDYGPLDILGTPAGSEGWDQLTRNATMMDLGDFHVDVASITDLILMKQAAGRPKDLAEVEVLGALRDLLEEMETEAP